MSEMPALRSEYDLIVIGSGGGSMAAALTAKTLGKRAVILEKMDKVGGSTSFSGGVWWIPNSSLLREAGIEDSYEKSRQYYDSVVTYRGPGVTPARRDAFLKGAPRMLDFLIGLGLKVRRPQPNWPDYYDELPGGLREGRSIMPAKFNLKELGAWKDRLALYGPLTHMPMGSDEFPVLFLLKRTMAGKLMAAKYAALMLRDKITGRHTVSNGAAIQGRMLQIALREGIELHRSTPVTRFIVEKDRVVGVVVEQNGREIEVRARDGVIANVGGFSRNKEMRDRVMGGLPTSDEWTNANPGDTGEVIQAMMDMGAATDCLDAAWWVVTSRNTDGSWPEGAVWTDGTVVPFMHHLDLSQPFSIMVDQDGRRIADEAGAYMEIGERIYQRQRETGRAVPAWIIFDKRHRERYNWGASQPGVTPKSWLESGYMKKADTLAALAAACGIDAAGLEAEVARYNRFCKTGVDEDYGRGSRAFDNAHGDPTVKPNPNLGAIEQGPFYAVAIYPGDVGTAGGVVADEYARVLREDGSVIEGLYAVGNSTASVFGRCYPGAGASIGASFTFGYIAAHHSAGSNELSRILS
ncbi:FAD-binding protein [uncultured Sphingomonas sp.]|uniref:FAD-binding protein n=1 Tax=uncultured Sphingomonas sp. TaxID=158754 RepID=UPI0025D6529F|nr:FAD-binding protein [uncultured Sphingomonas sp.]